MYLLSSLYKSKVFMYITGFAGPDLWRGHVGLKVGREVCKK